MAVLEMYCNGKDRVLLTVLPSVHEPNACDMCEARRACTQRSPAAPKGAHLALKEPGCPMWKLRGSQEGHCHHCLHCPHLGESHPLEAGSKKGIKRVGRTGSCFLRGGQQGGTALVGARIICPGVWFVHFCCLPAATRALAAALCVQCCD